MSRPAGSGLKAFQQVKRVVVLVDVLCAIIFEPRQVEMEGIFKTILVKKISSIKIKEKGAEDICCKVKFVSFPLTT